VAKVEKNAFFLSYNVQGKKIKQQFYLAYASSKLYEFILNSHYGK